MYPWKRPDEPKELREARPRLTRAFVTEQCATGLTPTCKWPLVQNEARETETLQKWLSRHTAQHCSYCDSLMLYSSRDTIDHFYPKKFFPRLSYVWKNLYLCCDGCQRKGVRYDRLALRPDEEGYEFSRYFRVHADGHLSIIAVDDKDRVRAEKTLAVFDLNDDELVSDRCTAFRRSLLPRARPLPVGLDSRTALLRDAALKQSIDHLPFRFQYGQDPES